MLWPWLGRVCAAGFVAVLLWNCAGTPGEAARFGGSGEIRREYNSAGAALTIELSMTLTRGKVNVRISDPSGRQRYASDFGPGDSAVNRALTFPGEAGRWVAVLTLQEAEGRYELTWRE